MVLSTPLDPSNEKFNSPVSVSDVAATAGVAVLFTGGHNPKLRRDEMIPPSDAQMTPYVKGEKQAPGVLQERDS